MKLLTASREEAEVFVGSAPYAVISITDHDQLDAQFVHDENRVAVLRLVFDDVDERFPRQYRRITKAQAREIIRFARSVSRLSCLLIHCNAGISRSRGIALALADAFKWKYETSIYNAYVHRRVLEAYQEGLKVRGIEIPLRSSQDVPRFLRMKRRLEERTKHSKLSFR